jgi:hypothetical protein
VVSRKARELGVAFQALDLFAINLGAHGKDSAAVNKERTCAFLSTITNPSKWKNFANNVMRAHTAHQAGKGIYCLHGDKKLAVRLTMAGRTRTSFTSRPRGR